MRTLHTTFAVATVAISAIGASYAQGQMHGTGGMPGMAGPMEPAAMQKMMQDMMPAASDPASTREFKEVMMKMMPAMHQPFTGEADVDFRRQMIPHHQGAIDMAKIALRQAKQPETKRLAQKIIDDQEKEIAEMRDWLAKNGK